jgi:hypothetical protein
LNTIFAVFGFSKTESNCVLANDQLADEIHLISTLQLGLIFKANTEVCEIHSRLLVKCKCGIGLFQQSEATLVEKNEILFHQD